MMKAKIHCVSSSQSWCFDLFFVRSYGYQLGCTVAAVSAQGLQEHVIMLYKISRLKGRNRVKICKIQALEEPEIVNMIRLWNGGVNVSDFVTVLWINTIFTDFRAPFSKHEYDHRSQVEGKWNSSPPNNLVHRLHQTQRFSTFWR